MKLYRVVNDSFDIFDPCCLWNNDLFEALYYTLGYTSFHISNKKRDESAGYNTEYSQVKEDGKFFFIFPEDAYKNALDVSFCQSQLNYNIAAVKVLEYEVPFDVATKIIGCGYYNLGSSVEVYVEKHDFTGQNISSNNIEYTLRHEHAKEEIQKSKEFLTKYRKITDELYQKHLDLVPNIFCHHATSLIKDCYVTGKTWNIYMPSCYGYCSSQVFDEQTKRLIDEGLFTDLDEYNELKNELINAINNNEIDKARTYINRYRNKKTN